MSVHTHQSVTFTSPAAAGAAFATGEVTDLQQFDAITVRAILQGGTGGILNVGLWVSFDGGTTYLEWFRSADIAAGTAVKIYSLHPHHGAGAPIEQGRWTSGTPVPALAKGTIAPGLWGTRMKIVCEAGAGMSAGAAQTIIVEGHKA